MSNFSNFSKKEEEVKIAVSGKGGAGKTTLVVFLSRYFSQKGENVILVDADPDMNLARSLGFSGAENIVPITEMRDLISQRTQSKGGVFKLNPEVSDIPDKFFARQGNIKLMVSGTIKEGGGGCACPENTFLKALLSHLLLQKNEVVIIDMPAGVEHLGRGTASSVDVFLIVTEAGKKSIETTKKIVKLADDLKIKNVYLVGNKIKNKEDEKYIQDNLSYLNVIGYLPYSEEVLLQDRDPGYQIKNDDFTNRVEEIIRKIVKF